MVGTASYIERRKASLGRKHEHRPRHSSSEGWTKAYPEGSSGQKEYINKGPEVSWVLRWVFSSFFPFSFHLEKLENFKKKKCFTESLAAMILHVN